MRWPSRKPLGFVGRWLSVMQEKHMKLVAALLVLTGTVIGAGAALEFRYFGPETRQFWAGAFAAPAGGFLTVAGILLWRRGRSVRWMVLFAGLFLACATVAATALDVMGPPATLLGALGSLVAIVWARRRGALAV
jgi:hypothetical protein